jgi:Protein of unknown function (DUF1579)
MKLIGICAFACSAVLGLAAAAAAQEAPPLPKPGPEHAIFKEVEGTWDAKVETFMAPGAPTVSAGTEVNRVGCGGLCSISDFKGTFMNTPFEGHGTETWDITKKKYVGSWTDSMAGGLLVSENTYDPASKTMTGVMEGPDGSGKIMKSKGKTVMKDANTRVMEMYDVGPGGKETLTMRITYTRKK